ncbi:MAG: hypothetical protein CMF70_06890 [Magnetovibrio sp.]|nr:hypothetical protein [Magnetovibrio sp.]|tara:strand:- start:1733 stop:1939 length:207 start_codon:yes stop_codon:yes gene_type:complete
MITFKGDFCCYDCRDLNLVESAFFAGARSALDNDAYAAFIKSAKTAPDAETIGVIAEAIELEVFGGET